MQNLIPEAALNRHIALLGMTGSGKTTVAKAAIVEPDLAADRRVLVVTPKDDWWGLRLSKTGKSKGFDIPIFGGFHQDYALEVKDAALLAETYGTMKGSAIFCTARLSVQDRALWWAHFAERLLMKNRGWVRLMIDEAHVYMPKTGNRGGGNIPKGLHAGTELVGQGRSQGIRIVVASQRVAKLHNDALTQCDSMVALRVRGKPDRDAVEDWIAENADPARGKQILSSLATLKDGQGWVWTDEILECMQFPRAGTFDSSAAPEDDDGQSLELPQINLDALKGKLATIEAKRKADNPAELRAELAKRDRSIETLQRMLTAATAKVPETDPATIEAAARRGYDAGVEGYAAAADKRLKEVIGQTKAIFSTALTALDKMVLDLGGSPPDFKYAPPVSKPSAPRQPMVAPPKPQTPSRPRPASVPDDGDRPLKAERKPLAALARIYPGGMTEGEWAVASGLKRSGGTWSTYLSRLRGAGRVREEGGRFFCTDTGLADLGENPPSVPPPGMDRLLFWVDKLGAEGRLLTKLADVYPEGYTKDELAAEGNLAAEGGTFSTYLSRLRGPGLIEDREGRIFASVPLMVGP